MLSKFFRLIYINFVLLKYGLDRIVWATPVFRPLYILIIFFPWRWFQKHEIPEGKSIRLAFEALGPIFVKFGQTLSTRRDLLPDDVADELAKLQDKVPPFPGEIARKIIETSLGHPIDQIFMQFDTTPLASASIAQVHPAVLHDGTQVVVKVLRPKIERYIRRDVELMETFAGMIYRYVPQARRFRPVEVVEEFKSTLFEELDLLQEAANASQLRRNFTDNQSLYIPEVFWQHSHRDILVMERVHGIPISDIQTLKTKNANLKRLAEQGVEIFFTQVFRDCFFHADMHPGNIFVIVEDPENPKYVAVDFGIMGTLGPEDQRYLGENFLAFFQRDYRRVAELHIQSGWVPPYTRVESFESAIRGVCEPIFERPLKDISFGQTLLRLFQTARQFEMQVQPQLVLLQKTLLTVEGLGRQLYPELDLWNTAKPFLEKWMKQHYGWRGLLHNLRTKFPIWSDKMPDLPEAIHDILRYWQTETHFERFQKSYQLPEERVREKPKSHLSLKIFGATLVISAALLAIRSPSLAVLYQYDLWIMGGAAIIGMYCIFKS